MVISLNQTSGYSTLRALIMTGALLSVSIPALVSAQAVGPDLPVPSVETNPDKYGIDLATGALNLQFNGPSAGTAATGISHARYWVSNGARDKFNITLQVTSQAAIISDGSRSASFTNSSGTFTPDDGSGASLSVSGQTYTYTRSDGTVTTFEQVQGGRMITASSVRRPDGETLTLAYDRAPFFINNVPQLWSRVATVDSNNGYRLTYSYASDEGGTDSPAGFMTFKSVVLTNTQRPEAGSIGSLAIAYAPGTTPSDFTYTDISGRASTYQVNQQGRIVGIIRPGSSVADLTIAYGETGRISSVTDAAGVTSYAYSDSGSSRTTTVTDPNGGVTSYVFDIASQKLQSRTDATGHTTAWQYDGARRVTRVTQPEGNFTQYSYDTWGNVVETRSVAKPMSGIADGVVSASFPCSSAATCNKPEWTRDESGNQTDYAYDPTSGNLTSVSLPANPAGVRAVTTYSYGDNGGVARLAAVTSCLSATTCAGTVDETISTISYTSNGLPGTVTNRSGDSSAVSANTIAYDAAGNIASVDGPLDGTDDTTFFRYDSLRQQVGEISADPDGAGAMSRRGTKVTYDLRGRRTLVEQGSVADGSDAAWAAFSSIQQVTRAFDGLDRPLSETISGAGANVSLTQYSYDGNRLDCIAIRMNSAEWGGLPPSACTAQNASADGADRITKYGYDAASRIIQQTSSFGTNAPVSVGTAFSANGKATALTDPAGNVTSFAYDGLDRLSVTTFPGGSYEQLTYDPKSNITTRRLRDGNSINYGFDSNSRLISVVVPKLQTFEFDRAYTYDLLGNMIQAADSNGHYANMTYDALGRQISETSNFSTRQYSYDAAGRRTRLTWQDGAYVSYDYLMTGEVSGIRENSDTVLATYSYDDLGRRISVSRANGVTTTYGFDAGSRLASLTQDLAGTGSDVAITFTNNAAGQITGRSASNAIYAWDGATPVSRSYAVNGLNQYTQAGDVAFSYDGRGNLTASGSTPYGYTSENLLASSNAGYLAYDPLGRLYDENGQLTLQYDGPNLITEQNAAGIARRYVFGPGDDEPIVWYEGAGLTDRRWLIADERGSIIAITDGAGNANAINRYDEYGIPAGTNMGRFEYTGQKWLPTFGLYDYKARTYSPTLGRFLQPDPAGFADGANLYSYAGNDPINYSDPTGLFLDPATITVIGKPLATFTFTQALPALFTGIGSILSGIFGGGISPAQARLIREQQQVQSEQSNRNIDPQSDEIVVNGRRLARDLPAAAARAASGAAAQQGILDRLASAGKTALCADFTGDLADAVSGVITGGASARGITFLNARYAASVGGIGSIVGRRAVLIGAGPQVLIAVGVALATSQAVKYGRSQICPVSAGR